MKKLYIIRHAKSSWAEPGMRDFDRPLNKRGKRDAPLMGKLLRDRGVTPDYIVASPAHRAQTTARLIAKEVGFPTDDIILAPKIYEAYLEDLIKLIQNFPNDKHTVLMFGHNPAFTFLVNHFNQEGFIDNVPTCGVGCIEANIDSWKLIHPKTANLISFDYPKMYV